jgi:hypothetical protein
MTHRMLRGAAASLLALAVPTLLAACGAPGAGGATAARVLAPTRVVAFSSGATGATALALPLTAPRARDRVDLRLAPSGYGMLRVTDGRGRTLLTLEHAGAVAVLEYGRRHLPVVVVQGDAYECGSGGCAYTAYTYDAARRAFVAVAGALPAAGPTFAWSPRRRAFVPLASPNPTMFGFAQVDARGLILAWRLYDALGHMAVQRYALAATSAAVPGTWRAVGAVRYVPDTDVPPDAIGALGAPAVAEDFLTAACLGLPRQAASLAVPTPSPAGGLYERARRALGPCAVPAFMPLGPAGWRSHAPHAIDLAIYAQTGPAGRLRAWRVRLGLDVRAGRLLVSAVSARALPVRYADPAQALARAAAAPALRRYLATHRDVVVDAIYASGPSTWTLALSSASGASLWRLDAHDGALTAAGTGA